MCLYLITPRTNNIHSQVGIELFRLACLIFHLYQFCPTPTSQVVLLLISLALHHQESFLLLVRIKYITVYFVHCTGPGLFCNSQAGFLCDKVLFRSIWWISRGRSLQWRLWTYSFCPSESRSTHLKLINCSNSVERATTRLWRRGWWRGLSRRALQQEER